MTAAEFALWKLEHDQVLALVKKVEAAERQILASMKLPTTPEAVEFMMTAGTWPRGVTARHKRRAGHAMNVLVQLRQVRRYLGPEGENARRAAHAALVAGLFAGDSVIVGLEQIVTASKGGKARGVASTVKADGNRRIVVKAWKRWTMDDDAQFNHSYKPIPFVRGETGLSAPTVRKHLVALGHISSGRKWKR